LLHAHESSDVVLTKAVSPQALRDLWSLSFRLPETAARTRCFDALAELVRRVPVWDVRRPLTMDSLPALLGMLKKLAAGD